MTVPEPRRAQARPAPVRHHFRPPDPADIIDHPVASDAAALQGPRPPRPWFQLITGQWPLLICLIIVAVGVGVAAAGFWRRGTTITGAGMLAASVLRLVVPAHVIGLLECRSKAFDVAFTLGLGAGIIVLAWIVPPTGK